MPAHLPGSARSESAQLTASSKQQSAQKTKGLSVYWLKVIGYLLVLLSILSTTVLPKLLGAQSTDDMAAMTLLVVCEVASWVAVPIYAWLLVEGMHRTHSRRAYGLRLLALALVCEVPYDLASTGRAFDWSSQNPVFALVIALALLCLLERIRLNTPGGRGLRWAFSALVVLAGLAWILLLRIGTRQRLVSLGSLLLLFAVIFYYLRERENTMMLLSGLLGALVFATPAIGVVILHFRNDSLGYRHQWTPWVFYLLYPLTLLLCAALVL
ncbi:hypothetical protein KIM372_06670 [Bombiscardovia nodaiensis]|uniref:ABC transporter permease n=1 Tax=Bombiscardovia nodaiensis TaxID=2932181 RepID=A0ABM8B7B5_9BIFI|nr:hypothetical protein KIM372_06670 [Bombiscardovia nodaiensis]